MLIDFGLCREVNSGSWTVVGSSGYIPPEVRHDPASWSAQGDLYSLGKTLQKALLPKSRNEDLDVLLKRLTTHKTEDRGEPGDIAAAFGQLNKNLQIQPKLDAAREAFLNLGAGLGNISDSRLAERLREVVEKHASSSSLCSLGLHSDDHSTWLRVGLFLNDMFEVYSSWKLGPASEGDGRSLSAVRHMKRKKTSAPLVSNFDIEQCSIVGSVRKAAAHSKWKEALKNAEKSAKKRGGLRGSFRHVADALDRTLQTRGTPVRKLTDKLLKGA